ncbi:S-formylglutathione hydrolase [Paraburkholderia sp. MM5477-R1]
MKFGVFLPPQASLGKVAGMLFLGGIGDSEQTFPMTAGAQRYAAKAGIALISPDTSPRGPSVPDAPEERGLGLGAGFYVDATQTPWSSHFWMFSYILHELLDTLASSLPINTSRMAICGHSMGGHGALVLGLRNRHVFKSISAFAPIAAPAAPQQLSERSHHRRCEPSLQPRLPCNPGK